MANKVVTVPFCLWNKGDLPVELDGLEVEMVTPVVYRGCKGEGCASCGAVVLVLGEAEEAAPVNGRRDEDWPDLALSH